MSSLASHVSRCLSSSLTPSAPGLFPHHLPTLTRTPSLTQLRPLLQSPPWGLFLGHCTCARPQASLSQSHMPLTLSLVHHFSYCSQGLKILLPWRSPSSPIHTHKVPLTCPSCFCGSFPDLQALSGCPVCLFQTHFSVGFCLWVSQNVCLSFSHTFRLSGLSLPGCPFFLSHTHRLAHSPALTPKGTPCPQLASPHPISPTFSLQGVPPAVRGGVAPHPQAGPHSS